MAFILRKARRVAADITQVIFTGVGQGQHGVPGAGVSRVCIWLKSLLKRFLGDLKVF